MKKINKEFQRKIKFRKYLKCLDDVGPNKVLGDLPWWTIRVIAPTHAEQEKFFDVYMENGDVKTTASGPMFVVYDEGGLISALNSKQELLSRCGWPVEPLEFIKKLHSDFAENPELFRFIASLYNDKVNIGLSDNQILNRAKAQRCLCGKHNKD